MKPSCRTKGGGPRPLPTLTRGRDTTNHTHHSPPHRGSLSPQGEIIPLPTWGVFPHRGRSFHSPPGEIIPLPTGGVSHPTGGDHSTPHRGSLSTHRGRSFHSPPGKPLNPKGRSFHFQLGEPLNPKGRSFHSQLGEPLNPKGRSFPKGATLPKGEPFTPTG